MLGLLRIMNKRFYMITHSDGLWNNFRVQYQHKQHIGDTTTLQIEFRERTTLNFSEIDITTANYIFDRSNHEQLKLRKATS